MKKTNKRKLTCILLLVLLSQSGYIGANNIQQPEPIANIADSTEVTDANPTEGNMADEDYMEEEILVKAGKGDLPIYNLYGPVKSCFYEDDKEDGEFYWVDFDRKGRLTSESGSKLSEMFKGKVERNKDGRMVYGNRGIAKVYYYYDDAGFLRESIWAEGDNEEYCTVRKYYYDKQGLVRKISYDGLFPDQTFTILETDSYGNWTKRINDKGYVTYQRFTYYK